MNIKLSHSSANTYRQCPQKYFLSRKWVPKVKGSALFFGTAIEEGVTEIIKTGDLKKGTEKFYDWWENEEGKAHKPIKGSSRVEYYKSDFDKTLAGSFPEFLKEEFSSLEISSEYDDWQDLVAEALLKRGDTGYENEEEISGFLRLASWYCLKLKGKFMLRTFFEEVYPEIEELVPFRESSGDQVKLELEGENGDSFRGYVDYLIKFKGRDKPTVADCKTAANPYTEHDIKTSDQLRTYVYILKNKFNLDFDACYMVLSKRLSKAKFCKDCSLDLPSTKRKCPECGEKLETTFKSSSQLLFEDFSEEALELAMDDYDNLSEAIDNSIVFRNTSSCNAFGKKCDFYGHCWDNKKLEDLDLEPKLPR